MWIWRHVFFLWANYFWLGAEWVTPDLFVAVLVYLATTLLFRIRRGRGNWLVFAGLGALLGLGYLAKAAMFPLSLFFCSALFAFAALPEALYARQLSARCWRPEYLQVLRCRLCSRRRRDDRRLAMLDALTTRNSSIARRDPSIGKEVLPELALPFIRRERFSPPRTCSSFRLRWRARIRPGTTPPTGMTARGRTFQ